MRRRRRWSRHHATHSSSPSRARGYAKKTIAVDGNGVTPSRWENIKRNLPDAKIVDGSKLLDEIRMVKTLEEVELIKKATEIAEKSMEDALEIAQAGIMELDLSQMFSYSVAEDGGRVTKRQHRLRGA